MKGKVGKKKARAGWLSLLCAVLLFVGTAWIVWDDLFMPFEGMAVSVEIPDFRGRVLEDVALADWMELDVQYRHDTEAAAGVVLSQSPVAGSWRKLSAQNPTCKVTLTVSLGKESARIPEVVGLDFREAESMLRGLGFSVEIEKSAGAYPAGTVFAVEPRANTELPVGSRVKLFVSAGLPAKSVTVPDLRGLSRSDALVQTWLAELAVGEVIEVDSSAPEGVVVRQSHQPGTLVTAGSKLTLYVSRGLEE